MMLLAFSLTLIQDWVQKGYWIGCGVVCGLLLACGMGLPLPEDIPLIVAGAFLVKEPQDWAIVGTACWLGIIGGDCILYFLGRRYGMGITRLPVIGKHVTRDRIEHVETLFEKYGVGVVAVGRLFAGIRGAMVVTAGTIKFNFLKFIIADGIAAIISGGLFMILGHWIGSQLSGPEGERKIREFKHWFLTGGLVLAILLVVWIIWRKRSHTSVSEVMGKKLEKTIEKVEQKVEEKRQMREESKTGSTNP